MLKAIVGIEPEDAAYKIAFITGSGTAANETVLSSIGSTGRTLVISNGEFGERLFDVVRLHNKNVDHVQFKWQEEIDLKKVAKVLAKGQYKLVSMVHHETSTGMLNPVEAVAALAHRYGARISVDAISSIGAETIALSKWGVDVLVGASGKALSAMPGVGILIVHNEVLVELQHHTTRVHYLDLAKHFHYMDTFEQTPNTPAVQVFVSLYASLCEITSNGILSAQKQIAQRAQYVRQALDDMGLTYEKYGDSNSRVITCVKLPAYMSFPTLSEHLKAEGIVVYNGKGILKDKIFQIGHIGALRPSDTKKAMREIRKIMRRSFDSTEDVSQLNKYVLSAKNHTHVTS